MGFDGGVHHQKWESKDWFQGKQTGNYAYMFLIHNFSKGVEKHVISPILEQMNAKTPFLFSFGLVN